MIIMIAETTSNESNICLYEVIVKLYTFDITQHDLFCSFTKRINVSIL